VSILGRPGRRRKNVENALRERQDLCGSYEVESDIPVGQADSLILPGETQVSENTVSLPPIPLFARLPAAPQNPDLKRLFWDPDKRAFRLIRPPARCGCVGRKSVFGELLTCGLCDGRATPPRRFQPGPTYSPCRYCGVPGEGHVCRRCAVIRRHRRQSGITADDQLLVEISRVLAEADRRDRRAQETVDIKKRRQANRRRTDRRWANTDPALPPVSLAASPRTNL
jgi:hypothetical protein